MSAAQELEAARKFWSDFINKAHSLADDAGHCETYDRIIEDAVAAVPVPEGFMDPTTDPQTFIVRRKVRWVIELDEETLIEDMRVYSEAALIREAGENFEPVDDLGITDLISSLEEVQASENHGHIPVWNTVQGYEISVEADNPSEWEIFEG